MTSRVIFGAFVPQGWKMELSSFDGAEAKWAKAVEVAQRAEQLGYDSVWLYDHVHNVPRPAHEAVFECWTTIAAISQVTSRVRLGQMVGCNSYRAPSLLAKITSTVDVISGGRLDWGIGAGWYENEYRGYGYDFPPPRERIGRLRESVEIVRSMWTQAETTYHGKYYDTVRANCDPKPLQQPHPPIWIGGGGEQLTLRVVARHADIWHGFGGLDTLKRKIGLIHEYARGYGRDPSEILISTNVPIWVGNDPPQGAPGRAGAPPPSFISGEPAAIEARLREYVAAGVTYFILGGYNLDNWRRVSDQIIPRFTS